MPVLGPADTGDTQAVAEQLAARARRLLADSGSEVLVLGCAGMTRYRHDLEKTLGGTGDGWHHQRPDAP
ncbi:MAG: aspartate/glutamate racemase family protein [Marinobacter sp.]